MVIYSVQRASSLNARWHSNVTVSAHLGNRLKNFVHCHRAMTVRYQLCFKCLHHGNNFLFIKADSMSCKSGDWSGLGGGSDQG